MDKKELNNNIFSGKEVPEVLFQPRIETWYSWNKEDKYEGASLPEKYNCSELLEIYDDLDISKRYMYGYWPISMELSKEIKTYEKKDGKKLITVFETRKGELYDEKELATGNSWINTKYLIRSRDDLEKAVYLFENISYPFSSEAFEKGADFIGNRGEPQFYVPRSGYQALCVNWMGMENTVFALQDYPELIERVMAAIDHSYDSMYESISEYGKVKIINFGENIDSNIVSPRYFEQYCIPFYEKRVKQLKNAGIYTHIHMDGSLKPILKYLKSLPFDAYEALTPLPQGDVTVEEIKENIGDKILIDGIPAILFINTYPIEELMQCVETLIKLFFPRLILGASDELPPPADIERVRIVSDYLKAR